LFIKWFHLKEKLDTDTDLSQLLLNHQFILNTPWIAYNKTAEFIRFWLKKNKLNADDLLLKAEVADWPTIVSLVASGYGMALIPSGVDTKKVSASIIEIEIPETIIPSRKFHLSILKI
jgi:hypothetical protein